MSDIDIFAWKGVSLPYAVPVTIQQLTCYDWFYIYLPMMSRMVNHFYTILPDVDLLKDYSDNGKIEEFKDRFMIALNQYRFRNFCIGMFKKLGFIKCSRKKFLKNTYINDLCEMFLLTYLFNTEGLKKKLKFLIERAFTAKQAISEISSTKQKNTVGSMKIVDKIERPQKKPALNL